VHISDHGKDKLDAKSQKCTFIGYGGDDFGYHFWDDKNRKIIRSRDVVFNEKLMYKDRDSKLSSGSTTSDGDISEYFGLEDLPLDSGVEQNFGQTEEIVSEGTVSDGAAPQTESSSTVRQKRRSARVPKPNPK
jgi:hypothetical protein